MALDSRWWQSDSYNDSNPSPSVASLHSVLRDLGRVHHLRLDDDTVEQRRSHHMISDRPHQPQVPSGVPVATPSYPEDEPKTRCVVELLAVIRHPLSLLVVEDAVHIPHKEVLHHLPGRSLILGEIDALASADPEAAEAIHRNRCNLGQLRRRIDRSPRATVIGRQQSAFDSDAARIVDFEEEIANQTCPCGSAVRLPALTCRRRSSTIPSWVAGEDLLARPA